MTALRYTPGVWRAVVTPSGVAVLPSGVDAAMLESIWSSLAAGNGLGAVLESLTGAFGTSLRSIPPFAVATIAGTEVRLAVRGELAIEVEEGVADAPDGTGAPLVVSGADVTTWSERVVAAAHRVTLRTPAVPAGADWFPIASGVVLAASVTMHLTAAAPSSAADSHSAPGAAPTSSSPAAAAAAPATTPAATPGSAPTAPSASANSAATGAKPAIATTALSDAAPSTDSTPSASAALGTTTSDAADARGPASADLPPEETRLPEETVTGETDLSADTATGETAPGATSTRETDLPEETVTGETATSKPDLTAETATSKPDLTAETAIGATGLPEQTRLPGETVTGEADLPAETVLAPGETADAADAATSAAEAGKSAATGAADGGPANAAEELEYTRDELPDDAYDHLWGATVVKSVEEAAVRDLDDEQEDEEPTPAERPRTTPSPSSAAPVASASSGSAASPAGTASAATSSAVGSVAGNTASGAATTESFAPPPAAAAPTAPAPLPPSTGLIDSVPQFGGVGASSNSATLIGHTVPPTQAPATAPAPPPTAGLPAATPGDDHDGLTVTVSELEAMRRLGAAQAEAPAAPVGALGRIVLSTGETHTLDRPVIIGRRPRANRVQADQMPLLVTVASPEQDISRNHLEVRLEGRHVLVVDLATTNGSVLHREGTPPLRLGPNEPVLVLSGDLVDIGDGITIAFEEIP